MNARPLPFASLALTLSLAAGGCAAPLSGPPVDDSADDSRTDSPLDESALRAGGKLDLLFVIDSSGSMREEQLAVLENIEAFVNSLSYPRSLHIGVITPDIGLGSGVDPQCDKDGSSDGILHVSDTMPDCEWATQPFISDSASSPGDYQANYPHETDMTFGEAFACLADVGTFGCGFEQPIAAANLALDGRNPGFRREDAALAVIFVTDEDDCSADDFGLFDPNDASLGALSSFRCTRFGITCDQDVNSPGEKSGCTTDELSPYMLSMELAADSLAAHVSDPSDLFVGTLAGPTSPVAVEPYNIYPPNQPAIETLALVPSCSSATGDAVPAVRLGSFADALQATGATTAASSICQTSSGLSNIGAQLANFMLVE